MVGDSQGFAGCSAASLASTLGARNTTHTLQLGQPKMSTDIAKYVLRLYIYRNALLSIVLVYVVRRKDFFAPLL